MHILIVDDDAMNRLLLEIIIKQAQEHTFQSVTNGLEAIETVANGNFDIVFMDINMPILDGIETTQKIRANTSIQKQPIIIAITADARTLIQLKCQEVGMNGFILKPVSIKTILEFLK